MSNHQEFEFISYGAQEKSRDADLRKKVRRNAMKRFRQQERMARVQTYEASKKSIHPERPTVQTNHDYIYAIHLSRANAFRIKKAVSLGISPSSDFDPFSTSPIGLGKNCPHLFYHFMQSVAPQLQPLKTAEGTNSIDVTFGRNALEHPALLSAILFHAGVHIDSHHGSTWSMSTLYHRGQAIGDLNTSLQDPKQATSDAVIATVGLLAASGTLTGNIAAEASHRQALRMLVDMRGGMRNLGWEGGLEMLLLTEEMLACAIAKQKPTFNAPDLTVNNTLLANTPVFLLSPPPLNGLLAADVKENELLSIIGSIKTVASLHENFQRDKSSTITADLVSISRLCLAIEHRLLCLDILYDDNSFQGPTQHIYEACRNALLICMSYLFRSFRPVDPIFQVLVRSLIRSVAVVEVEDMQTIDSPHLKMLLWACWIGGLAASKQDWLAQRASTLMAELQIRTWNELEKCLKGFVWADGMRNASCAALWDKAMAL